MAATGAAKTNLLLCVFRDSAAPRESFLLRVLRVKSESHLDNGLPLLREKFGQSPHQRVQTVG